MTKHTLFPTRRPRQRGGYVMLIALILLAILSVIGSTSLQGAGLDHQVAIHNQRHMIAVNTADAGVNHARTELVTETPLNEGLDTGDTGLYINATDAETMMEGLDYAHNLGVYTVRAEYVRCGNPPPGYSTETGSNAFRSDYWRMESTSQFRETASGSDINETTAVVYATLRNVEHGGCKVR